MPGGGPKRQKSHRNVTPPPRYHEPQAMRGYYGRDTRHRDRAFGDRTYDHIRDSRYGNMTYGRYRDGNHGSMTRDRTHWTQFDYYLQEELQKSKERVRLLDLYGRRSSTYPYSRNSPENRMPPAYNNRTYTSPYYKYDY